MQLKLIRLLMLRSLKERPLRILLSTFGIVLGVASILAISLTNRAALDSVTKLIYDTTGRSQLSNQQASSGSRRLCRKHPFTCTACARCRAFAPVLQISAVLVGDEVPGEIAHGLVGGLGQGGLSLWGIDPWLIHKLGTTSWSTAVSFLTIQKPMRLSWSTPMPPTRNLNLVNGLNLLLPLASPGLKLVGLIGEEGAGRQNNGAFGVLPLKTAQKLFDQPRTISQIDLISTFPDTSVT